MYLSPLILPGAEHGPAGPGVRSPSGTFPELHPDALIHIHGTAQNRLIRLWSPLLNSLRLPIQGVFSHVGPQ